MRKRRRGFDRKGERGFDRKGERGFDRKGGRGFDRKGERGELKILCSEQVCAGTECALGIKDCFAQE